jgi:hypothetical protein
VRRRVISAYRTVETFSYHRVASHQDRADRNLTALCPISRKLKRSQHMLFICV